MSIPSLLRALLAESRKTNEILIAAFDSDPAAEERFNALLARIKASNDKLEDAVQATQPTT